MTCFAARVMQEPLMANPTIVVITDRNDLDGQLFGVFSLAQDLLREQPVQASTRQELRALLGNRPSGGIVFATIQKFMPGEDEDAFPLLSSRSNIVVIADEAHRTQYGFEAKLKTVKPRPAVSTATTVLTTGAGQPAAHKAEFAADARYPVERYQVGHAQHLRDALPNATFVAFTGTEDEEESQQAKLKSRWAALEKVVGAAPRIASVAADVVTHFEECANGQTGQAQAGKAMVVGMSRDICAHLYNEIIKLRPAWHSADPELGAIKVVMTGSASDKALLRPHVYSAQVKKRLEKRFKNSSDPLRIVIVRDMWLTGFDAPCVHTLYIDKPMKGHNLMQAIARVNRVFKDKQGGLVVDYIGIANELKSALKEYTASQGRGRPTVDAHEAYSVMAEKLDALRGMLHGHDYSGYLVGGYKALAGAADFVLGIEEGKKRFADLALAMSKAFTLCCTLDEAKAVREEVAFFQGVKVLLTKRDITVRNPPERNLAVELLERLLEGEIKSRFASNVVQNKKFSDMLTDGVQRYQNRSIAAAQVMEELVQMARKFREAAARGEQLGLSEDEVRLPARPGGQRGGTRASAGPCAI